LRHTTPESARERSRRTPSLASASQRRLTAFEVTTLAQAACAGSSTPPSCDSRMLYAMAWPMADRTALADTSI